VNSVDISNLSDDELLVRTELLAFRQRFSSADLIQHLAEIDRRNLTVHRDYGSLFEYCVNRLKMSEGGAYRRIRAARTFAAFPPALELLRDGRLSIESLAVLHPFRHADDIAILVAKAAGMRTRQLEALLSGRQEPGPQRDVVRYVGPAVPAPRVEAREVPLFENISAAPASAPTAAKPEAVETPRQSPPQPPPRSLRIAFTADENFFRLLAHARSLLRHKYPDGRLAGVLKDALTALLAKKDPGLRWSVQPAARTRSAREGSRRAA